MFEMTRSQLVNTRVAMAARDEVSCRSHCPLAPPNPRSLLLTLFHIHLIYAT